MFRALHPRPLLIAIVLLTFARPSLADPHAKPDKEVEAEGKAPGTNANAAEQAKQDALRRAVEQACGTFITGQTNVKNYAAVYDRAMSICAGYVKSYEILEHHTEDGMSFCKVRAVVSLVDFEKEWARLLHTLEAEGNPRCVVVVMEDNDTDDRNPPKPNGVAQGIIENFFLDKGVQLMDRGASEDIRTRDVQLAAANDDVNKLAAAGAALKADVVVMGVAEAKRAGEVEIAGKTMYKWTATINIRAYHTDSAQMLMSNTYTSVKSTMNRNGGGDAALRQCAEENIGRMLSDIGEAWRKRQNVRRTCQIILENCSRKDYKAFEEAMLNEDGVQGVRLRELVNNVCQVEVDWAFDLERLIARIEKLKVPDMSFEVTEQTKDRAVIKVDK